MESLLDDGRADNCYALLASDREMKFVANNVKKLEDVAGARKCEFKNSDVH